MVAKEQYLSVNWLEFFGAVDRETAIGYVRDAFVDKGYGLSPNGRFLMLSVGSAKFAASEADGIELSFTHMPRSDDDSHSAIFGLPDDDLDVAVELKLLVTDADIFPAIL